VAACGALFVLALAFLIFAEGHEAGAVLTALGSQSLAAKVAWAIVVLVPLVLVPGAVWLGEALVHQRRASQALTLRLDGVRQGVNALVRPQVEAEAAVAHLARTDPEDTLGAMKQRLSEAERFTQVQSGRNEIGDLAARVEEVRGQQQALQTRLGPVLEKRRSIEQLLSDLDNRQGDIERTLVGIANGDDAVALDIGLKRMAEFVRQSHERCDGVERAAQVVAGLHDDFAKLQERLIPFAAADDGVGKRVRDLSAKRERLAEDIAALEQTPHGTLAARVQKFAEERNALDARLSQLDTQFSSLATLRDDVGALSTHFDRALDALANPATGKGVADVDTRVEELTSFIETTQAQLGEIERRAASFTQLKTKLAELQSRLQPLEAGQGGVVKLVDELRDARDRLFTKIRQIEDDEDGGLAERVKKFSETKRELEDRVTNLTEQFSKLATIRRDIAGLFDKLSGAVNTSAN
jgi:chromosome segregation ATPase